MKRALSVALVTVLSLLVFLVVGYAQEEAAEAPSSALLDQELASMEEAFGGLQSFMTELIGEVKGNMGDIGTFNAKVDDLKDVVTAISVELKDAEGKIVGLREDVDGLSAAQQDLIGRVDALEGGLSDLASFCDQLKSRLDVNRSDLDALADKFSALVDDYGAFKAAFDDYRASVEDEISSLRDDFTADLSRVNSQYDALEGRVAALEEEDVGTFKKKVIELERSMAAVSIRVDNNRAKLEGFDGAIAALSDKLSGMREGILQSNQQLLDEYDARITALEEAGDVKSQIDTLYFISIVALLAGVGALIWGFIGQ